MRKVLAAVAALVLVAVMGCSASDVASRNLSTAADNFELQRRIVFYNGITGAYILVIEGRCALGNYDDKGELTVTCKVGPEAFKKHFLGLSDNVTYFSEQLDPARVDDFHYRVIFRPETLGPGVEVQTKREPPR